MGYTHRRLPARGIRSKTIVCTIFALGLAGLAHAGNVFHVHPSGDLSGESDWANIMQAFEGAKAAGTNNCTVVVDEDVRPIVNDEIVHPGHGHKPRTVRVLDMGTGIQFVVEHDDEHCDDESDHEHDSDDSL